DQTPVEEDRVARHALVSCGHDGGTRPGILVYDRVDHLVVYPGDVAWEYHHSIRGVAHPGEALSDREALPLLEILVEDEVAPEVLQGESDLLRVVPAYDDGPIGFGFQRLGDDVANHGF